MTALAARRSAPQHWAPWTGNRPPSAVTSHRMFKCGIVDGQIEFAAELVAGVDGRRDGRRRGRVADRGDRP